jgi:hypothetical protein
MCEYIKTIVLQITGHLSESDLHKGLVFVYLEEVDPDRKIIKTTEQTVLKMCILNHIQKMSLH